MAVMAPIANSPPTAPSTTDCESEVGDMDTFDCELGRVGDSDIIKPVMFCCMHTNHTKSHRN